MNKILILVLFWLPFTVWANNTNNHTEQIVAYFDMSENLCSGKTTDAYYYRTVLQNNSDGSSLIQDFYVLSEQAEPTDTLKLTDPYKIKTTSLKEFDSVPIEGTKTMWAANGVKFSETNYLDGKPHGASFAWYPVNGEKWIELNYVNGKKEGSYTSWYLNGQKEEEGQFLNGLSDGLWLSWYEDGKQKSTYSFKNGEVIKK